MPAAAHNGSNKPTRGRVFFAGAIVVFMLITTWKFIDYRTQPPMPEEVTSDK